MLHNITEIQQIIFIKQDNASALTDYYKMSIINIY